MSHQPTEVERVRLDTTNADLKSFSCLTCRQRKVKCDRRNPCTNCLRGARQCSFIPPVRGKPKRRKAPKEGLHAKLRRYELLLKSYGVEIEPSDDNDDINHNDNNNTSDVETLSEPDVEMAESAAESDRKSNNGSSFALDEVKARLVTKNGSSRYFDNGLWSNLGDEFHNPEEDGIAKSADESTVQGSDLFVDSLEYSLEEESGLVLNAFSKTKNLAGLHHPFHILQKMLDIYIDRVDPLMKILHVPTFWSTLTTELQNPHDISKSLEAAIFGFYFVTIISLDDSQCYTLLGERKKIMTIRYKIAARQALVNADFLNTSSLRTLQAYTLFLMGMRSYYRSDSLFILSGIAVRLARRMGLHRDGTFLDLCPFETEMRRRLWWHIVQLDSRVADFSGTKPSMDLFLSDTKVPLNVEDEDLSPDMTSMPPERTGITSIVFCLLRCDFIDFLKKVMPNAPYEIKWDNLTDSSITLAEKDDMINQMKDVLERKYLRYHDPSNPLHHFASVFVRSSICKMQLFAHNPRQFASIGVKVPQRSRDIIFESGVKVLEYASLMLGNQSLIKYMWQLSTTYLWDTVLCVLIEVRQRKMGREVDRAWTVIDGVFSNYPKIFAEVTEPLYAALGNWALRVWDDCAAARKVDGLPESPTPDYITTIRRCRRPLAESLSSPTDQGKHIGNSTCFGENQLPRHDGNLITDFEPLDSCDFSNLLSYNLDPNEWIQWERLLSGQNF